jgi:Tfp pilus assembly protein PilF
LPRIRLGFVLRLNASFAYNFKFSRQMVCVRMRKIEASIEGGAAVASDQARELRARGIAAAKAGSKEEARQLLQQSVRIEPRNEAAWLWLASVARDAGRTQILP